MSLLLDLTIRSSVIMLVALVACVLLRKRSAALRHWVLAAGLLVAAAVLPLSFIVPAWAPPISTGRGEVLRYIRVAAPAATHAPPAGADASTARPRNDHAAPLEPAHSWPWLVIIWGAGGAVNAVMLLAGFGRLLRIASRAEQVREGPWMRLVAQVSAAYGLKRPVVLLQTDHPEMLATLGLFRPRVLLPSHAPYWSDHRTHIVLCHELAHIQRRDWVVQVCAEALRTIYWFNPLLWMVCNRLRRESEQACDDAVLDAGVPARDYAAQLLDLARTCGRSGPTWASALPMAHPSTLERRIAAMLNPGLNRKALTRRAVIITTVALLGVALPIAGLRAAAQVAPTTLSGTVYDTSGAVLPGVDVTLLDERQVKWQAVTDGTGRFQFAPLGSGHYVLEASLGGFRSLRHEFDLRQARDWDRAITLQVGTLQETITVTGRRTPGPRSASRAASSAPVRVGGNIRQPHKLKDVKPVYPQTMQDEGVEGVVPMEAVIGRDGSVLSVRVISAQVHPELAIAAADAVRQWRFQSTLLNGVAVEVVMTVSVRFGLTD